MTAVAPLGYLEAVEAADASPPSGLPSPILLSKAPQFAEPKWLVRDFWPANLLGLLVGDGGTFKSSLALHIAGAVAGGYTVFDRYQAVQQPVLVLSAEDQEDVMRMRVEAFIRGHGWEYDRVMNHFHVLAVPDPVLGSIPWRRHLQETLRRLKIGFLVLDPWADLIDGDENANSEIRPVIKYLRQLMADSACSIAVVHHMGKGGPDKRVVDRIRGATGLPHASRVIYAFEWHEGAVHVENVKMSRTERLQTFVLDRVIRSSSGNRMLWDVARVTTKDAGEFRDTEARRWVLFTVQSNAGSGTNDLKDIARRTRQPGHYTPKNQDLQSALKSLVAEGYIMQIPGPQQKRALKLTESGLHLLTTLAPVGPRRDAATSDVEEGEGPDLFAQTDYAPDSGGMRGIPEISPPGDYAPYAPTMPRHSSDGGSGTVGPTPPLRGARGQTGYASPLPETDDLRAQADERAGLEEGL